MCFPALVSPYSNHPQPTVPFVCAVIVVLLAQPPDAAVVGAVDEGVHLL